MVPREEYGLLVSHFDDDMTRVPYSLDFQQHHLLHYDDIHMHGCIDETSLSYLKSSCFLCSLFGSDFGGASSFTCWMKEHMADYYFNAYYIILEKHFRTQYPQLCHWGISDIIFTSIWAT